jgi:hypothetical protein
MREEREEWICRYAPKIRWRNTRSSDSNQRMRGTHQSFHLKVIQTWICELRSRRR